MKNSKRMISAILIDPFGCGVWPVEVDGDDVQTSIIENEVNTVDDFTVIETAALRAPDVIFADEDGMEKTYQRFFELGGYRIAGKALIVGFDDDYNKIAPVTHIEAIRAMVVFPRN